MKRRILASFGGTVRQSDIDRLIAQLAEIGRECHIDVVNATKAQDNTFQGITLCWPAFCNQHTDFINQFVDTLQMMSDEIASFEAVNFGKIIEHDILEGKTKTAGSSVTASSNYWKDTLNDILARITDANEPEDEVYQDMLDLCNNAEIKVKDKLHIDYEGRGLHGRMTIYDTSSNDRFEDIDLETSLYLETMFGVVQGCPTEKDFETKWAETLADLIYDEDGVDISK